MDVLNKRKRVKKVLAFYTSGFTETKLYFCTSAIANQQ